MSQHSAFTDPAIQNQVVKNLEPRWGLTLASFLPPNAQDRVVALQQEIVSILDLPFPYNGTLSVYGREHLHCTHLTLQRSTPNGPIAAKQFVKSGHHVSELFDQIQAATAQVDPFVIQLNRLTLSPDGLGIILVGECRDAEALRQRATLLSTLNATLPAAFNLGVRAWDTDPEQYNHLHCAIGYLKRPLDDSVTFEVMLEEELSATLATQPITLTFETVSLVHHRYRSLRPPHEGSVVFLLGRPTNRSDFDQRIHLA